MKGAQAEELSKRHDWSLGGPWVAGWEKKPGPVENDGLSQ